MDHKIKEKERRQKWYSQGLKKLGKSGRDYKIYLFKIITERSKKIIIMKEQENMGGKRQIFLTGEIEHLEKKNMFINIQNSAK